MSSPQLIIIDETQTLTELIEYLKDKEFVAYDTETTGVSKHDEVVGYSVCTDESVAYYVILAKWNVEEQKLRYLPGMKELTYSLLSLLQTKKVIAHNAVFDCMITETNFKISLIESVHTDTMILAHLLDENRRVGLKDLGASLFGEDATAEQREMKKSIVDNGGLITKDHYELYKADAYTIARYGAKDALLTYKLFLTLVPELYDQNLDKFFYEDESMPLLRGPTYELNTTGVQIDLKRLLALKKTLQAECLEAKAFVLKETEEYTKGKYPGTNKKNHFNIGASQQLSWLMFGQLKLEFGTLTKAGKIVCRAMNLKLPYTPTAKRDFIETCLRDKGSIYEPEGFVNGKKVRAKKIKDPWAYIACDKKTLKKLSHRYVWIEKLLEYQRKTKLLNTYVEGIESRAQYGIIQPSFLQHGTTSGRYSSRNPNWQNLPRDDKRIKECVVSRAKRVFVGADQSQLEPRVFAFTSGDQRLLEAFRGADDFYSVIGMEVYEKSDCTPRKEGSDDAFGIKYKKLRDLSKVIALASTYGATAHQLAPTTGKSIEDTAEDIAAYFEKFPGVAQMMLDSHEQAKTNGYVLNHFGRPRRIPEARRIKKLFGNTPHGELPYEARSLLNLAVNHRIQSTGASIMNRAAIKFYENKTALDLDCKIVCQVHDSLIVECLAEDAETVGLILQDSMENTIQLEGIVFEAIPKIGVNFAEV